VAHPTRLGVRRRFGYDKENEVTDTEAQLRQRIRAINPQWFTHSGPKGESVRDLLDIWPLPGGRVLFSSATVAASGYVDLYVLDPPKLHDKDSSGYERIKCVGSVEGHGDLRKGAVAYAIDWMQGLRDGALRHYDKDVLGWLGEMAYRMTPVQLTIVQTVALNLPQWAWGDFDNPNDVAGKRLAEVLSALGFSDDYIGMHLT
jgi:hypothetical protein